MFLCKHVTLNVKKMAVTLIVAAFDIGTTFSGWAYSFTKNTPDQISTKQVPQGTDKVPTSLFLSDDGSKVCFGYLANDALENYSDDDPNDFLFFERFKMVLHQWELSEKTMVTAVNDKSKKMTILKVLSLSLECLVKDFQKTIKDRFINVNTTTDIEYVITIPAIWTDQAKQIMRKAAENAGIPTEKLILALEPEACSVLCRRLLNTRETRDSGDDIEAIPEGTKYIVIDAGGGTVDIAVHEVMPNEKIRELYYATGGGWGGTMVDAEFEDFLISETGEDAFKKFKENEVSDYIELRQKCETKKVLFTKQMKKCVIKLPPSLFVYKNVTQQEVVETLQQPEVRDRKNLTVRLTPELMQSFFTSTVRKTTEHLKKLLQFDTNKDVSVIFMAGGFSDCDLLQSAVREACPDLHVIIPPEASLCTLKGAVLYGHSMLKYKRTDNTDDLIIQQRVSKYTYGYSTWLPFVSNKHPLSKRILTDNRIRCKDIFSKVIEIGQTVNVRRPLPANRTITLFHHQKSVSFKLFASEKKGHEYIDEEGCRLIGKLEIVLPDPSQDAGREVDIMFAFGGTELKVTAKDVGTGHTAQCQLDFLSIESKMINM